MLALSRRLSCLAACVSRLPRAIVFLGLALSAPPSLGQNRVLGYQDCQKCHKPAINKWRVEEARDPKAHVNTNKQLSDPKAKDFAAAINLADPAQPGGRCVECHATTVRGVVRGGVSCESCHGPASGYLEMHDDEPFSESYKKAAQQFGLRDLHGRPAEIARMCVSCHVTPDPELVKAKHPRGENFDAGAGLKKLVHWTPDFTADGKPHASYDYAQVSSEGRAQVQKALARSGPARTPGPGKATPAPSSSGVSVASARPPSRPAPAQAPLSLFDEAVVALQCPPDCPSDTPSSAPVATSNGASTARTSPPAAQPAQRLAPRSIVVDAPLLAPPALEPPPAATPSLLSSRSRLSAAAAQRGRAADLLTRLLATGKKTPSLPVPSLPVEYQGPDSELLNLQDLALHLALETLRKP